MHCPKWDSGHACAASYCPRLLRALLRQCIVPLVAFAATAGRPCARVARSELDIVSTVTKLIPQNIYAWEVIRRGTEEFNWSGWYLLPEEPEEKGVSTPASTGRNVLAGVMAWRDPVTGEDHFVHGLITEDDAPLLASEPCNAAPTSSSDAHKLIQAAQGDELRRVLADIERLRKRILASRN